MVKNIIILIMLIVSVATMYGINDESKSLNAEGMKHYYKKDYTMACHYFLKAIEKDKNNHLAYYNLACTLCLIRADQGPCNVVETPSYTTDLQLDTIFYYLQESIKLSKDRIKRTQEDSDLAELHKTLEFYTLFNKDLRSPDYVVKILTNVTWQVNYDNGTPWIFGDGDINFKDNTFTLEVFDEKKIVITGTYTINGSTIQFNAGKNSQGITTFRGELRENKIIINDFMGNKIVIWNNTEECSA